MFLLDRYCDVSACIHCFVARVAVDIIYSFFFFLFLNEFRRERKNKSKWHTGMMHIKIKKVAKVATTRSSIQWRNVSMPKEVVIVCMINQLIVGGQSQCTKNAK